MASNNNLCRQSAIPRDFGHIRARRGTALAKPFFRGPARPGPGGVKTAATRPIANALSKPLRAVFHGGGGRLTARSVGV
jgi:hypothetical protein